MRIPVTQIRVNQTRVTRGFFWTIVAVTAGLVAPLLGQTNPAERAFPQSRATVEKALKTMQGNLAGHLPVLDGFAAEGVQPLDRYQRGYYQADVQVAATAAGGSLVRISVKVTAWYSDPAGAHSGYQLLSSNGRLESDLLDQLSDQLGHGPVVGGNNAAPATRVPGRQSPAVAKPAAPESAASKTATSEPTASEPAISAPSPKFPDTDQTFSSSLSHGLAAVNADTAAEKGADKAYIALQEQAKNLEDVLKNQAHPKNLVAVKKSGTPVVGSPSLTAKPLFQASMHDEFEMLDFNRDWVHVRVSGLSRGWIWRNSVEMPDGIPDTDAPVANALAPAADLFHVLREETAPFPGDWEPLRGKNVKILSVQKIEESTKDAGPRERLEYAKSLLDKDSAEILQKPQDLAGIVLIFDSADGGMIAATAASLQQWKTGKLTDAGFWHQCFFDPPETFVSVGTAASQ